MSFRTRFAPSPTGYLHIGHAYSALVAYDMAQVNDGEFILRIEDTDQTRSHVEFENAIYEDLEWLGLNWSRPVIRQSERLSRYAQAIDHLSTLGLLYPCSCNRRAIRDALSAPQEGAMPVTGPDGLIYPGTCRHRPMSDRKTEDALRLNMRKALDHLSLQISFVETGEIHSDVHVLEPEDLIHSVGDVVLGRRENGQIAYHLAVVIDDADQAITHVVRGADLFDATKIHVVIQALLSLSTPMYHHHRLIRDETGKRLAKRDDARAIRKYRDDGFSPEDIRKLVGL